MAPSFTVGAICVVERSDGALLLVRHSYRDRWGFPGGLLQRGEEVAAGARREVLEEVDLAVELVGEPAVVVAPEPRRVDVVFRARPSDDADLSGMHPASPEIVAAEWYGPDDLPKLQEEASTALVALARADGGDLARLSSLRSRPPGRPGAGS
jgi:ADP-ribose pyrophosphatase YjhB (NUDIX family)